MHTGIFSLIHVLDLVVKCLKLNLGLNNRFKPLHFDLVEDIAYDWLNMRCQEMLEPLIIHTLFHKNPQVTTYRIFAQTINTFLTLMYWKSSMNNKPTS